MGKTGFLPKCKKKKIKERERCLWNVFALAFLRKTQIFCGNSIPLNMPAECAWLCSLAARAMLLVFGCQLWVTTVECRRLDQMSATAFTIVHRGMNDIVYCRKAGQINITAVSFTAGLSPEHHVPLALCLSLCLSLSVSHSVSLSVSHSRCVQVMK